VAARVDRASQVPVLILAWRRPELVEQVLAAVAQWQPRRLFLACDGWNSDASPELVSRIQATRAVLDREPGWPCEVQRRYAEGNRGLRAGVVGALDWFFAANPEGIVLEDDCIPSPEFGSYCAELLERYRDDPRVMCISGDGSSGIAPSGTASYSFIRYPLIWGWATWRRAWSHYDRDLEMLAALDGSDWGSLFPDITERRVWRERFEALRGPTPVDTWDLVWALSLLLNAGLSVHPRANLISNIGFGADATHTTTAAPRASVPTSPILPLRHPDVIEEDEIASRRIFDAALGGSEERRRFVWERTIRGRVRLWIHHALVPRLPTRVVRLGRRAVSRQPWR
jgi:hypothetical protein